jgi:chaperonin GroES
VSSNANGATPTSEFFLRLGVEIKETAPIFGSDFFPAAPAGARGSPFGDVKRPACEHRRDKNLQRYFWRIIPMKIRPLHDRVVIRRKEEEQKTAGGIVLPGSAKEKPNQGVVVAVGSGRVLDNGEVRPVDVKVGDTVVFGKYAGSDTIEINGEELVILSESDIKAVLQ